MRARRKEFKVQTKNATSIIFGTDDPLSPAFVSIQKCEWEWTRDTKMLGATITIVMEYTYALSPSFHEADNSYEVDSFYKEHEKGEEKVASFSNDFISLVTAEGITGGEAHYPNQHPRDQILRDHSSATISTMHQNGFCHSCGIQRTHNTLMPGQLSHEWDPLTVSSKLDASSLSPHANSCLSVQPYAVYNGYCLQPTCYTLLEAKTLMKETSEGQPITYKQNAGKQQSRLQLTSTNKSFSASNLLNRTPTMYSVSDIIDTVRPSFTVGASSSIQEPSPTASIQEGDESVFDIEASFRAPKLAKTCSRGIWAVPQPPSLRRWGSWSPVSPPHRLIQGTTPPPNVGLTTRPL